MEFKYDTLPDFISWKVNGVPYAKPMDFMKKGIKVEKFDYTFTKPEHTKPCKSFREECIEAAKLLPDTTLAIPVSGGDSEIVARAAKLAGKDAVIYYEDYGYPKQEEYKKISKKIADELGYKWVCHTATYLDTLERMLYWTEVTGWYVRGHYINNGLLDKIPDDQFIIVGGGELEKDGSGHRYCAETFLGPDWDSTGLIVHFFGDIVWRIYAEERKKKGQYYFFNSTWNLNKSMFTHPLLRYGKNNTGVCSMMEMKLAEWPELLYREKTDNYGNQSRYLKVNWKTKIWNDQRFVIIEQRLNQKYPIELWPKDRLGFFATINKNYFYD